MVGFCCCLFFFFCLFLFFFLFGLAALGKRTHPSGLECPVESHPWPSHHHLAVSVSGVDREMGSGGLAFLLTSWMTRGCKTQHRPFHLDIWKQRSPWAHHICPAFPSFISRPISSVAVYTSAQVPGKWSVSVNDFFIYVRERPIKQIQWDKFREFVSSCHLQVWLCSGAQTQNRLVKMGSFFWKKFISMERNMWWLKSIEIPAPPPGNSTGGWKELTANKVSIRCAQEGWGDKDTYPKYEWVFGKRKLSFLTSVIIFNLIIDNYW